MEIYGLIGYPLEHSFSPDFFKKKFHKEGITDTRYQLFPIDDISAIHNLIENNPQLKGLNVTIPYKEQIIKYLDFIDPVARKIGSVNTLCINRKSGSASFSLKGFNTDYSGFLKSLDFLADRTINNAIVLGSGGSAKAVCYALGKMNIPYFVFSRKPGKNSLSYSRLDKDCIKQSELLINTTPLGMYPKINTCPDIPYEFIGKKHILYDLVYNPEETLFLKKGKKRGAMVMNGLKMLQNQAEDAWKIWNN